MSSETRVVESLGGVVRRISILGYSGSHQEKEGCKSTQNLRQRIKSGRSMRGRRCPRCRMGHLNEWTGICNVCGYPEFNEDEPCYECEGGDCDECEYARELRGGLKE